jgi:hypothetical protein
MYISQPSDRTLVSNATEPIRSAKTMLTSLRLRPKGGWRLGNQANFSTANRQPPDLRAAFGAEPLSWLVGAAAGGTLHLARKWCGAGATIPCCVAILVAAGRALHRVLMGGSSGAIVLPT